jgi:hypothetical protein
MSQTLAHYWETMRAWGRRRRRNTHNDRERLRRDSPWPTPPPKPDELTPAIYSLLKQHSLMRDQACAAMVVACDCYSCLWYDAVHLAFVVRGELPLKCAS